MSGGPSALVLLAHGARDPQWAVPFEAVAAQIRTLRPGVAVRLAFLDFMAPDLAGAASELVSAGARRIEVLPMFLGTGGHVRQDVPRLLDALRGAHPQIELVLHPAIGEIDAVARAMAAAIVATVEGAR